ncbi:response regulator [Dyadobacter sp. CY347]|uniref:response regulator n=1 Tax=Dyadobacter sp. CY347 TaxID=2909336 RepID=UPI001F3C99D3|nr:response regulator [Dyadobacter sp. CY347]MCF2488585.1 response regulator [Dyadobacter sp. CY347]
MNLPAQFIVVDDDPINNMVCKYVIANVAPAASIQLFTDPEKALSSIKETFSESTAYGETVLFLDINMPTMSGWEFLNEVSLFPGEVRSQIDIYILSSSIDPEDIKSAEEHPLVQGYYSKPLSKEVFGKIYTKSE